MNDDKGAELNERVWKLFDKAGFHTRPNANDSTEEFITLPGSNPRPVDLSASISDLEVKIIGENKSGALNVSFDAHVHDFVILMQAAQAKGGLFVFTGRAVTQHNRQYASERGIVVWGEDELRYYEAVVEAIGEYAKYEIIHSFGIRTEEETNVHNVLALQFSQPYSGSDNKLYLFTITPEKLLKTCVIYRKAQGSGEAYQRMLKKERLHSVRKFVTQQNALLPPNIIVHFSDNVRWERLRVPDRNANGQPITLTRGTDCDLGMLTIPMKYASLELIDGQHRLYGFAKAEPATREHFNLVAVGMLGLPFDKKRDMFVAINDKSRRMDPNLVAYLKDTDSEVECQNDAELMAIRIVVELNKNTPFKNKIRLLDIGDQKITLKGFSGYDLEALLKKGGLLRKYYQNDSNEYVTALRLYFGVLQSMFRQQCEDSKKYIIFTNRGISAFLKLLKSILKTCDKPLEKDDIKTYLQPLKDKWPDSEWEIEKLKGKFIGAAGWKDFHRELVSKIQEVYPDFKE